MTTTMNVPTAAAAALVTGNLTIIEAALHRDIPITKTVLGLMQMSVKDVFRGIESEGEKLDIMMRAAVVCATVLRCQLPAEMLLRIKDFQQEVEWEALMSSKLHRKMYPFIKTVENEFGNEIEVRVLTEGEIDQIFGLHKVIGATDLYKLFRVIA
jgi:hypothetical protein